MKHNCFFRMTLMLLVCVMTHRSFGQSKEILEKLEKTPPAFISLPADYASIFPEAIFDKWDKGYEAFTKFLTPAVMRTQMGLSYKTDSVQTWWCMPSARPHVQLDTSTRIADPAVILGDWRVVANRNITYTDSASYVTKHIYRVSDMKEHKDYDVYLSITPKRITFYGKEAGKARYENLGKSRYTIESGRYLLRYGLLKSAGGIALIGLDKDQRLIFNSYRVEERKVRNNYITYETAMHQFVFERIK